ncbi:hypothetical protein Glove_330g25 [Diversispora epigaea]|uniref:Protein kinase domain-containing protein n=1 Tax=Diversispora epigaea TaxID=1348612 RepID=A0A397HQ68_9GLOM|nr:hypothetical protein Glove_330g25 [Diversispora epigaea]
MTASIFPSITTNQLPDQSSMKNSLGKIQSTSPLPIIIRTDDNDNVFEEWIEDQVLNNEDNNNDNINIKDNNNNNNNIIKNTFSTSEPNLSLDYSNNSLILYNDQLLYPKFSHNSLYDPVINNENNNHNSSNNSSNNNSNNNNNDDNIIIDDDDLSSSAVTPQLSSTGISEITTTESSITNSSNSGSTRSTPPQFIFKKPLIKKLSLFKEIKHVFVKKSKKSPNYTNYNYIKIEKYGQWGKVLGSGIGGTVRLIHRTSDNKTFAAKQFRERYPQESAKLYRKKIIAEFCIGSTLHHENIIETLDIIQENNRFYEIMEYAPYDLFEAVMSKQMSENEIACNFKQIINGVNYLHEMGIAHRDLKLDNLCVDEQGIIKIIDFGCSAVFKYHFDNKIMLFHGPCGSDPYICPESYTQDHYDARPADIWAIGVTLVCMHLGRFPWLVSKKSDDIFKAYLKRPEKLIKKMPESTRPIIRRILEIDPQKRATMKDILNDEWFKSIQVCSTNNNNNACDHTHHLLESKHDIQDSIEKKD